MKNHYHVYIASGFFTSEQIEEIEFIKGELSKRGLTFFSPKDEAIVEPNAETDWRQEVFAGNCLAIQRADMVIVNTNNKDMGTLFEAGYAYALNKPIIYVCFQLGPNGQLNLMLSESGVASCTTREQLCQALDGKKIYWEGLVE